MSEALAEFGFDRSKLALAYEVDRLQKEILDIVQGSRPYIHYSVIPLTTPGKRNFEIADYSNPDWTTWVETPLLKGSPYIQEVLDTLECRKTNVRLLRLEPKGVLQEHTDPQLNLGFRNQVRLHVPVFTSELVEFILNGSIVPLQPGELWYMRLSDPHSVLNHGDTERLQLSIDVVWNQWIEDMIVQGEIV